MSSESVVELIGKKAELLAGKSTIHGLSNLIQAKKTYSKIVWSFFIILCSSSCFFFIGKNVKNFFDYSVATKLRTVFTNEMDFPAIGIWYVFIQL